MHVAHVAQPVVDQAHLASLERGLHAAAAVVAADDDVLDLEDVDGVLQHREAVEVGVHDDVGDVAVHEELAGQQPDDLVRGDAAVGAADPEVARSLLLGKRLEEGGIAATDAFGPLAVLTEQVFDGGHRRHLHWG